MYYKVRFSKSAIKQLGKLDRQTALLIKNWVLKNLVDTNDPKRHGKPFQGKLKVVWRYRVGDYRLFAEFIDDQLIILIFEAIHRV